MRCEQVWAILQTQAETLADRPDVDDDMVAAAMMFALWTFMKSRLLMSPEEITARVSSCMQDYEANEDESEKERTDHERGN